VRDSDRIEWMRSQWKNKIHDTNIDHKCHKKNKIKKQNCDQICLICNCNIPSQIGHKVEKINKFVTEY
jgi:hypothetical protein